MVDSMPEQQLIQSCRESNTAILHAGSCPRLCVLDWALCCAVLDCASCCALCPGLCVVLGVVLCCAVLCSVSLLCFRYALLCCAVCLPRAFFVVDF